MIFKFQSPLTNHVRMMQTERCHKGRLLDMSPSASNASQIAELKALYQLPHEPKMLQQTHENRVVELTTVPSEHYYSTADACFTRENNVICSILTADCLPVLVCSNKNQLVAAIHCGWRSIASGIIYNCFEAMNEPPQNLFVWLGPCISQQAYEVGSDMYNTFISVNAEFKQCFKPAEKKQNKYYADLQQLVTMQWHGLGVHTIERSRHCTVLDSHLYHSWRNEKTQARMASMIWLNNN